MTILVPIALFGWVPAVLLLFLWFPPRRAIILAFMTAWLFLPAATFKLPGIPDYSKMTATCMGVLLGSLVFDIDTLLSFRFRWFDVPMLLWCFCPFGTNYTENIDTYDSMSWTLTQTTTWALPYFIGRVYFTDAQSVRELAIALFISGLIYVPICLFEIRMSPKLAIWIYGFSGGYSGMRLGGWRPHGLMGSGLMLAMWMTSASLLGVWLWFTGSLKKVGPFKMIWCVLLLVGTTFLCRSTGALALLIGGVGCLLAIRYTKMKLPYVLLCSVAIVYPAVRMSGAWDGASIVELVKTVVDADRAQSLDFRLKNEDILIKRAMERPLWGWGRFGGSRVRDRDGRDLSVTDGLWIISLGSLGTVGLIASTTVFLLPGLCFWLRAKAADWADPDFAAAAGFSVILALYSIDNLLNAMVNPVCMLYAGAVASMKVQRSQRRAVAATTSIEIPEANEGRVQRVLWPPTASPAREPVQPGPQLRPHIKWQSG